MAEVASKKSALPPLYEERVRFKNQLFSKAVPPPKGNTTYEELACIGFQPELNQLEAVIYIKQPVGYLGDICSAGSQEYVRFFMSFDKGKTWHDQGMTQFTAYDIPETAKHRLEYAVTLTINPRKHICKVHNFVMVRAILSWHVPPQPGNPNFPIHWGNSKDTVIQIAPTRRPSFKEIVEAAHLKFPPEIVDVLDFDQEIATVEPKPLTLAQLSELYKDKKVEAHRFGFPTALKMQNNPKVLTEAAMNLQTVTGDLPFVIGDVLEKLEEPTGNTFYEQLDCVGYDPEHKQLVATFRVKQGWGYLGGSCTPGSVEYVTFWGDFDNNGTFETCFGSIGLRVHDFEKIPEHGLEYGVSLPVDLTPYQQPCKKGPKLVRIRATLSWHVPHPCGSPNKPPVWGNAEDTVIQIPAGPVHDPENYNGYLYTVCGVNICAIDPVTGLTSLADQPFGAALNVTGEIPIAYNFPPRFKYKVWVRSLDPSPGAWQPLTNDYWIWVTEGAGGGIPSTKYVKQNTDALGWYDYPEYGLPSTGSWRRVTGPDRLLGVWGTVTSQTGRWEIGLQFQDTVTSAVYWAGWQTCPDGSFRRDVVVYLDQVRPSASLDPNLDVSTDGGTHWSPAMACDTFVKGVLIRGKYTVSDEHFRILSLYVQPPGPAHGTPVTPSIRTYPTVPTTGETGTWILDTTNMDPCGYVIRLDVWDRTIVSCDDDGWFSWASLGFCLKGKEK